MNILQSDSNHESIEYKIANSRKCIQFKSIFEICFKKNCISILYLKRNIVNAKVIEVYYLLLKFV